MSYSPATPQEQLINDLNLERTRSEMSGRERFGMSSDETKGALTMADAQGNGSGTDGFSGIKGTDELANNGIQMLVPKDRKNLREDEAVANQLNHTPDEALNDDFSGVETFSQKDRVVREDENNDDMEAGAKKEISPFDIEDLVYRARKIGIKVEDYFDEPGDLVGPDAEMMLQLLLKDVQEAEFYGVAYTEVEPTPGEIHDVIFRTDRVQNDRLGYYLEKTEEEFPGFLQDIWENASLVVVNLDPNGGPTRISISKLESRSTDQSIKGETKKIRPSFIDMDIDDFFMMTSVPEVNNGDSKIKTPEVRADNLKDWKSIVIALESIHSDGKPIGDLEHPAIIIKTKKENEEVVKEKLERIDENRKVLLKAADVPLWNDNNLTGTAFDKPLWPGDVAREEKGKKDEELYIKRRQQQLKKYQEYKDKQFRAYFNRQIDKAKEENQKQEI